MDEISVGDTLYGYCNGYFGRDSYGNKRVIAKGTERGVNWMVVYNEWDGHLEFGSGFNDSDAKEWVVDDDKEWEGI